MEQRTEQDFFTQPIFVTGAGRSGTSMVMGLFNRAGVWVGECVKGSPDNPGGYFENKRLRDGLLKPILSIHGYDKFGRDPLPEETLEFEHNELPELVRDQLNADGYMYHVPWGYKDAKLLVGLIQDRMPHQTSPCLLPDLLLNLGIEALVSIA